MTMAETTDKDIFRHERSNQLAALRMRRYRRRNREAERNAKRNAKRLARRIETGAMPITTYAEFVAYMVARRQALGLSQIDLDHECGFYSGYIGHLENWDARHGRVAGPVAMRRWLGALGVQLRPVTGKPAAADEREKPLNGAELARRY